ncbi:MAG TPA: GGDEF domain-containing protein, partial [Microthrixaceae bacterium]|nr:GGDEF domain-containing protein [Microthrixaceae bacterium]
RAISDFVEERFAQHVPEILDLAVERVGVPTSYEFRARHADGSERLVVGTLTTPTADWGDHIVLNLHDVTTQRDLETQLRHDASHDALTGLMNRKAFGDASERACARAARQGRTVGMLYIDLDGFKQINDTFGHDAGDRVLIEAGRRLRTCLTDGETLARLGGDEFAVLVDAVSGNRAIELAECILSTIGEPIEGLPNDARVVASIGIALRSSDGIEISTLMQDADAAMYAAKRNGRARWELNEPIIEV